MKIMAVVDRRGLPLSVRTHAANHHEVRLVQLCFDFYMIEAKPGNLIGDRAYDSDPLDAELQKDGIEMIAPHRGNRSKPSTQGSGKVKSLHATVARHPLQSMLRQVLLSSAAFLTFERPLSIEMGLCSRNSLGSFPDYW